MIIIKCTWIPNLAFIAEKKLLDYRTMPLLTNLRRLLDPEVVLGNLPKVETNRFPIELSLLSKWTQLLICLISNLGFFHQVHSFKIADNDIIISMFC